MPRKGKILVWSSISDPDPNWIRIQSGEWIRIRSRCSLRGPTWTMGDDFTSTLTKTAKMTHKSSVADPGCLSRILIFYPSRIPDPKTTMKDRGEKKFVFLPFFGAINLTKLNYFIFEMLKKKILGQFSKNYRTFYPKNCH